MTDDDWTPTGTAQIRRVVDGRWFSLDGTVWHLMAVNMASMGTVSCYLSGKKSSNGKTYRVDVNHNEEVYVR